DAGPLRAWHPRGSAPTPSVSQAARRWSPPCLASQGFSAYAIGEPGSPPLPASAEPLLAGTAAPPYDAGRCEGGVAAGTGSPGPAWRCVGATRDSEHVGAGHMTGRVAAWPKRIPLGPSLPTGVGRRSHLETGAPGGDRHRGSGREAAHCCTACV
ncbi:hypothetical protein, conserved, partial [Leishmania lindenbergi]